MRAWASTIGLVLRNADDEQLVEPLWREEALKATATRWSTVEAEHKSGPISERQRRKTRTIRSADSRPSVTGPVSSDQQGLAKPVLGPRVPACDFP